MSSDKTFLSGDVGGTKTLLAIYSWECLPVQIYKKKYSSREWNSLEEIIRNFLKTLPREIKLPNSGCIGVAGKVNNNEVKITNLQWSLSNEKITKVTGLKRLELINDFEVLIHGLPYLDNTQKVHIQAPKLTQPNRGISTIIGAGTGLGVSSGVQLDRKLYSFPSEGGHMEFSPRNESEWEMSSWLKLELNIDRLSIERVVSGSGLGNIAKWHLLTKDSEIHPLTEIASSWKFGDNNQHDLPLLASELASKGDPLMKKAVNMWLSAYGSAAGDMALQNLCSAGLWLCGGTAKKHLGGLKSEVFLRALHNKGRFRSFLEEIPITALVDPEVGLFSAACKAHTNAELDGRLV